MTIPLERYQIGNAVPTTIVSSTERGWIYFPRVASVSATSRAFFFDAMGLGYHLLWTPKNVCGVEAYEGTDWPDHQVTIHDEPAAPPPDQPGAPGVGIQAVSLNLLGEARSVALEPPTFHSDFRAWYAPGPGTLAVVGGDLRNNVEIEIAVLSRQLRRQEIPPPWRLTFANPRTPVPLTGPNAFRGIVAVELLSQDSDASTAVVNLSYGGDMLRRTLQVGVPLSLAGVSSIAPADGTNLSLSFHLEL